MFALVPLVATRSCRQVRGIVDFHNLETTTANHAGATTPARHSSACDGQCEASLDGWAKATIVDRKLSSAHIQTKQRLAHQSEDIGVDRNVLGCGPHVSRTPLQSGSGIHRGRTTGRKHKSTA